MTGVTYQAYIISEMWLPVGVPEEEELMPGHVGLNLEENLLASCEAHESPSKCWQGLL